MKCLETRTGPDGLKRRRYRQNDGTRLTTVEVPLSVLRSIGMTRVRQATATWQRGEERRARAAELRATVIERLQQPRAKPTAIAHELGCTEARVRQIRQEWLRGRDVGE